MFIKEIWVKWLLKKLQKLDYPMQEQRLRHLLNKHPEIEHTKAFSDWCKPYMKWAHEQDTLLWKQKKAKITKLFLVEKVIEGNLQVMAVCTNVKSAQKMMQIDGVEVKGIITTMVANTEYKEGLGICDHTHCGPYDDDEVWLLNSVNEEPEDQISRSTDQ